jgi:excinuclease ABC subunit B
MKLAIEETERRRKRQLAWNKEHGLVPRSITKSRADILQSTTAAGDRGLETSQEDPRPWEKVLDHDMSPREMVTMLEEAMTVAARALEFEKAAALRDRIEDLKAQWGVGQDH